MEEILHQIAVNTQKTAENTAGTSAKLDEIDRSVLDITGLLEKLQVESANHSTALNAILQKQEVLVDEASEQAVQEVEFWRVVTDDIAARAQRADEKQNWRDAVLESLARLDGHFHDLSDADTEHRDGDRDGDGDGDGDGDEDGNGGNGVEYGGEGGGDGGDEGEDQGEDQGEDGGEDEGRDRRGMQAPAVLVAAQPQPQPPPPEANLPGAVPARNQRAQRLREIDQLTEDARRARREHGPDSEEARVAYLLLDRRLTEYDHRNDPSFVYVPPAWAAVQANRPAGQARLQLRPALEHWGFDDDQEVPGGFRDFQALQRLNRLERQLWQAREEQRRARENYRRANARLMRRWVERINWEPFLDAQVPRERSNLGDLVQFFKDLWTIMTPEGVYEFCMPIFRFWIFLFLMILFIFYLGEYCLPVIRGFFHVFETDADLDVLQLDKVIARNPGWERVLREL